MNTLVYNAHSLDGKATAALAGFFEKDLLLIHTPSPGELDSRTLKLKDVAICGGILMPDRLLKVFDLVKKMTYILNNEQAFDDIINHFEENNISYQTANVNHFIKLITAFDSRLSLCFSDKLSISEIFMSAMVGRLSAVTTEAIGLIGQYEMKRELEENQLISDLSWENNVLPFNYGMAKYKTQEQVSDVLSAVNMVDIIFRGKDILNFKRDLDEQIFDKIGFEAKWCDWLALVVNSENFDLSNIKNRYFAEVHDLFVAFHQTEKNVVLRVYSHNEQIIDEIALYPCDKIRINNYIQMTLPYNHFKIEKSEIILGRTVLFDISVLPELTDDELKQLIEKLPVGLYPKIDKPVSNIPFDLSATNAENLDDMLKNVGSQALVGDKILDALKAKPAAKPVNRRAKK